MITFILIFFAAVIAAGLFSVLGFAFFLKRRNKSLETTDQKQFGEPPPYRPLFAPTDEEVCLLEREEQSKREAERIWRAASDQRKHNRTFSTGG